MPSLTEDDPLIGHAAGKDTLKKGAVPNRQGLYTVVGCQYNTKRRQSEVTIIGKSQSVFRDYMKGGNELVSVLKDEQDYDFLGTTMTTLRRRLSLAHPPTPLLAV